MTESELREIIESQGLAGLEASIFTKNRVYIGRVGRINVTTLMIADPKVAAIGEELHEIVGTPSIAEAAEEHVSGLPHKYVAIAIDEIEAIGF
ncbi:MAG: hypothetical protein K6T91_05020 [Firmicutes bacterium]|nr:hypothetical protein [Bacillota bacterium]